MMKTIKIEAVLRGLAPLMFDRFFDHSAEERPPEQKLYLNQDNFLVMPAANLVALLTNERPPGAIKLAEKKKANDYLPYVKGHVHFSQIQFPISDDNGPIIFTHFDGQRFFIDRSAPRVIKGSLSIKQESRSRPVLSLPWFIKIGINLIETEFSKGKIVPDKLYSWFSLGGLVIGLGTYRPLYGRFELSHTHWQVH